LIDVTGRGGLTAEEWAEPRTKEEHAAKDKKSKDSSKSGECVAFATVCLLYKERYCLPVKGNQAISCFTAVLFYHIKENAQFLH